MRTRRKILYVCGSINQTTQMHKIAENLPEHQAWFTPYFAGPVYDSVLRPLGLMEQAICGNKLRARCLEYLRDNHLDVDLDARSKSHQYDLVLLCTDQAVPPRLRDERIILVQEGMLDPKGWAFRLQQLVPGVVPRWIAGTAATGQSKQYERFCVASEGYRDYFIEHGLDPQKLVVTGIPNFDDCAAYAKNDFPHRDYVLACTSDGRETGKSDDREKFLRSVQRVARDRQVVVKLHPNELVSRAKQEIESYCPGALVYTSGSAEEMVANCSVLCTEYSTLTYVGLALKKEVHSYFDLDELRRMLPIQNRSAAFNIANVCRDAMTKPKVAPTTRPVPFAAPLPRPV